VRILLTGHAGYIGAVASRILAEAGHEVVGLDIDLYRGCDLPGEPMSRIPALRRDVRDVTVDDVAGFDAIVHLAGLSNDPLGALDADLTRDVNYRATVRLADMSRRGGVERFVFSSSCSIYGASGNDSVLDETAPLDPLTAYAESKVLSEQALSPLADDRFVPVYLRNATAYGASPRQRLDLVVNNLTAWAHATGEVRLLSDGTAWRPVVHVEDIASAIAGVLVAPADVVRGQAYNVGRNDANHRVRELAEIVASAAPSWRVAFPEGSEPDRRSYRVSFGKFIATFPQVRLRWTVADGVRQLIDAYGRAGIRLADVDGPRYVRVRRIDALRQAGTLDGRLRWDVAT
jgi:nucleoside-diphosphate-sugar epimerase